MQSARVSPRATTASLDRVGTPHGYTPLRLCSAFDAWVADRIGAVLWYHYIHDSDVNVFLQLSTYGKEQEVGIKVGCASSDMKNKIRS